MALRKESRKAVLSTTPTPPRAAQQGETTMENLFTKEKRMGFSIVLLAFVVLALLFYLLWMVKEQPVPASPPQQETAPATSPCCCPCPQKTKAAVHPKKKKVQQPKPAPPATPPTTSRTLIASATKGCAEIRFTTKPGDTVVKFPVFGPAGHDIAKDSCVGIKRPGDSTFGPWQNGFCPTAPPILCDFSQHERIIGQKIRLMGSYRIEKQGVHTLRLPGFISERKLGYVTALILVRGESEHPQYPSEQPGSTKAFVAAYRYGEQRQEWIADNSDAIGVRWFDYVNGVATVYYSKTEVPKDTAQLYWPWGEWRGP